MPAPDASPSSAPLLNAWAQRARRVGGSAARLHTRFPWAVPLASFLSGLGSYVLVTRGQDMAQWVGAMALGCGFWLLAEGPLAKLLHRISRGRAPPVALTYVTQALQQEILFFALPFLLGATRPDLGQWAFTGTALTAAALTLVDPWYQRLQTRPVLRFLFHAWCVLVAALVALPLVAGLRVENALPAALAVAGVWLGLSLPAMWRRLPTRASRVGCVLVLLLAPLLTWMARAHVPPAGLVMREERITADIDGLQPGPELRRVRQSELANGLVAYIAVQAPDGLAQELIFEWRHQGQMVDSIPMFIHGTGDGGWRTFTRKYNFPEDALGRWRVDLRTPRGQLVARLHFTVVPDAAPDG